MSIESVVDRGHQLSEHVIKVGLRALNPDITIDPASNLGYLHPNLDRWQGVWYNGIHVCSMGRGNQDGMVPEYHVWALVKKDDGTLRKSHYDNIGWRHTFHELVKAKINGVTWPELCRIFQVPYKEYRGEPTDQATVEIA